MDRQWRIWIVVCAVRFATGLVAWPMAALPEHAGTRACALVLRNYSLRRLTSVQ